MKKSHIILIVLIAISIGSIMATLSDSSTYASFKDAKNKPDREFKVVGTLIKEKEMAYNPHVNANIFSFYMLDREGNEMKVLLNKAKPQDFERSEQIVLIGKAKEDAFYAHEILLKCPSKYNNGSPEELSENKKSILDASSYKWVGYIWFVSRYLKDIK